jgi:hypothetical protein
MRSVKHAVGAKRGLLCPLAAACSLLPYTYHSRLGAPRRQLGSRHDPGTRQPTARNVGRRGGVAPPPAAARAGGPSERTSQKTARGSNWLLMQAASRLGPWQRHVIISFKRRVWPQDPGWSWSGGVAIEDLGPGDLFVKVMRYKW